jgi:hypothetical protein
MTTFRIDHEDLPVEIEEMVERWITVHPLLLSDNDNHVNANPQMR